MSIRDFMQTRKGKAVVFVAGATITFGLVGQNVVARNSLINTEQIINKLDEQSQRNLMKSGLKGDITFSITGVDKQEQKAINNYLNSFDSKTAIEKIPELQKVNPNAKIEIEKIKLQKGLTDAALQKLKDAVK